MGGALHPKVLWMCNFEELKVLPLHLKTSFTKLNPFYLQFVQRRWHRQQQNYTGMHTRQSKTHSHHGRMPQILSQVEAISQSPLLKMRGCTSSILGNKKPSTSKCSSKKLLWSLLTLDCLVPKSITED